MLAKGSQANSALLRPAFFESKLSFGVRIVALLMVLSLFVGVNHQNFWELFDLYWYYPLYVGVLLMGLKHIALKRLLGTRLIFLTLGLILMSLMSMVVTPYPWPDLIKQAGGWLFFSITWLIFILWYRQKGGQIMALYAAVAILAAAFTLPEQVLHQLNIHLRPMKGGWLGFYRCYSIATEPFTLALLTLPVLTCYLWHLGALSKRQLWYLAILLMGLFFTFSGAGWLTLILILLAMSFQRTSGAYRMALWGLTLAVAASMALYGGTQLRITQTLDLFKHYPRVPPPSVLNQANSSSRALYLNAVVAGHQFTRNPITGGGLGSHKSAYEAVILKPMEAQSIQLAHYNMADGAAAAIRWVSETGLLGIGIMLLFIGSGFRNRQTQQKMSISAYLLAYLMHSGNYFQNGTFFWLVEALDPDTQEDRS